jgi:phage shock protein PspC (stress-responsive transcriptional regulator)
MVDMSDGNGGTGDAGSGARSDTYSNGFGGYPAGGPPAAKRLQRKRDGRWIAGVCAGLADYLGIDATVVRVVLAVLVLFGGLGPLVYVIAWVLMPEEGDPESIAERLINTSGKR